MITVKIDRDELRLLRQNFIPYMVQYCQMKLNTSNRFLEEKLSAITVNLHLHEVRKIVDRKLKCKPDKFRIKLNDAQGATLYKLLMNFPVDVNQEYMLKLRTRICDDILKQITEPQKELK